MTDEVTLSRRDAETLIKLDRSLKQHYEKNLRQFEARLIEHGATPEEISAQLAYWRKEQAKSRLDIFMQTWREMIAWAHEGYPKDGPTRPKQFSTLQ